MADLEEVSSESGSETESEYERRDDDDDDDFAVDDLDEFNEEHQKRKVIDDEDDDENAVQMEGIHFDDNMSDEETDDDADDEEYLKKFEEGLNESIIQQYHPELLMHNVEETEALCKVVRDETGHIIDPLHTTLPFITKYEKARVLGERARQIENGAQTFIEIEPTLIDSYLIAVREFEAKKIPFILRRPLPNGGCEYWNLKDLEIL